MKKFLLASAAAIVFASGAQAADLGVARVPVAAAVMAPTAFSWTGFYVGAHIGYGWGNTRFNLDPTITTALTRAGIGSLDHNFNGMLLGGQFGWNYQVNNLVFGLEASLAWANMSGSTANLIPAGAAPADLRLRTRMNWLATMGPRIGFAFDRAMIYAKGGFAAGGFNSGALISAGNTNLDLTGSFARGGWFLGAGVEYAFAPNWSAKLEYNYLDFGRGNWIAAQAPAATPIIGGANIGVPARLTAHTVTLGVNYQFSTGPSAVVARY